MLTHDFQLRLKALDDSGSFTGLASTYGPPADLAGDIVEPGAFKQAIASQGKGYPLLWAHKQDEPIGLARVSDSASGLVVDGSLLMSDPTAAKAHAHLKNGSTKGISIGYSLPQGSGKVSYNDDNTRTLKEVRLHEISLVAVPANPRAQVVSVKSLDQVEHLLRGFRADEAKDDVLLHLRAIDVQLKRLLKKDSNCNCDCGECLAGNCLDCSNPDCEDEDCDANIAAEELAALKQLAISLKSLTQ